MTPIDRPCKMNTLRTLKLIECEVGITIRILHRIKADNLTSFECHFPPDDERDEEDDENEETILLGWDNEFVDGDMDYNECFQKLRNFVCPLASAPDFQAEATSC